MPSIVKRISTNRDVAARLTGACVSTRLSDRSMKKKMDAVTKEFSSNPTKALDFLQRIGVATPTGKLTKRYR